MKNSKAGVCISQKLVAPCCLPASQLQLIVRNTAAACRAISLSIVVLSWVTSLQRLQSQEPPSEYRSYLAHIASASSAIRMNETAQAKRWLASCPGNHQQWEWRLLNSLADSSIRQLNTRPWTPIRVDYSPDGQHLCIACSDGSIRIVDPQSLQEVRQIVAGSQAVYTAEYDPTGKRLAICSRDGKLSVRSSESGELIWEQPGGGQGLADVAFHPNGTEVAYSSWYRNESGVVGLVSTWNALTGEEIWKTDFGVKPVVTVEYSHDGKSLAVGTWDAIIGIWACDSKSSDPVVLDIRDVESYSAIDEISFSPDDQYLLAASKNGQPRLWNLAKGTVEKDLRGLSSSVFSTLFTNDGKLLTGDADGVLCVWEPDTGTVLSRFLGHENRIGSIAADPTKPFVATTSADQTIRWWDVSRSHRYSLPNQSEYSYGLTVSDNGMLMAAGGQSPTHATVWDPQTGKKITQLEGIEGSINYLDFGPNSLIVGGNWAGDLIIWDAATGNVIRQMKSPDQSGLHQCAFDSLGKWIAVATSRRQVEIWNAQEGVLETKIPCDTACWGIDISQDSQWLAVGLADGTVSIVEVGTWKSHRLLKGHESQANSLKFSPDGKKIACGCESGRLAIYDLETGQSIWPTLGHSQRMWSVSFLRDGSRIATGGADKKVIIWDSHTGEQLMTLSDFDHAIYNVQFSPNDDDLFVNETRSQRRIQVPMAVEPAE